MTAAIRAYRAGGAITSPDQLAWLALTLAEPRVREAAWRRMDPIHREAHRRLWADLTRAAPAGYAAAPASLLAFTALQHGDGSLGTIALDRALADDPGYRLAHLLRDAFHHAAPPSLADPAALLRQLKAAGSPGSAGGPDVRSGP